MARLPSAQSLGPRPTPDSRRALGTINPGAAASIGRAAAGFGDDLVATGYRIGRDNAAKQADADRLTLAHAKTQFLKADFEARNALKDDPDYETYDKRYAEMLGKARNEIGGTIKSPEAQALFQLSTEDDLIRGRQAMLSLADTRRKDAGIASTEQTLADNADLFAVAPDPETRLRIAEQALEAIEGAKNRGYLDETAAGRTRRKWLADAQETRLLRLSPAERLRELGATGDIPGGPRAPVTLGGGIGETIAAAAAAHGENADTLTRIAWLESRGKPDAANPNSSARGLFQVMPSTAKQYGLADPMDPVASSDTAARILSDNRRTLRNLLGREPSEAETYLAHQQGATGAAGLLNNPDISAVDALIDAGVSRKQAEASVKFNGGTTDMTAAEFAGKWTKKFDDVGGVSIPFSEPGETAPAPSGLATADASMIPIARRDKLADTARRELIAEMREARIAEERAEKAAEKQLKQIGEDLSGRAWAAHAEGTLKRADVDALRPIIPLSEYKALLKAVDPTQETANDDPSAYAELYRLLDEDPAAAATAAYAHHAAGRIKNETLSSVIGKARSVERQEAPKSPYEQGLSFIRGALEPSPLSSGFSRDRAIQAEAIRDFEQWMQESKRTDAEIREYSEIVVSNYGRTLGVSTLDTLPPPLFGPRPSNTRDLKKYEEDLNTAELETFQRREAMSPAEYQAQVRILGRYRGVLDQMRRTQK